LVKDQCRPVVTKVFNCSSMNTGDVYGWAELGISNNGDWSFVGHSTTGQWWTWNYAWGISLTATDSQGRHFSFAHNGTLHGQGSFGSNSEDFGDYGHDPSLIPYWDSIAAPNSLTSSTESRPTNDHFGCNLHASQSALNVGLDVLVDLGLVATGGAILLAGASLVGGGGCWDSTYGEYQDPCGQTPARTNEDF
jgi:hypothetical protein